MWEPYPSYHNGLFSPLLVLEISLPEGRSISVLSKQYETSYLFYVTLSFLCNRICYLISMFVFSLVTLSGGQGNERTTGDPPNYGVVEIGQNTKKSPGDLRRLSALTLL